MNDHVKSTINLVAKYISLLTLEDARSAYSLLLFGGSLRGESMATVNGVWRALEAARAGRNAWERVALFRSWLALEGLNAYAKEPVATLFVPLSVERDLLISVQS